MSVPRIICVDHFFFRYPVLPLLPMLLCQPTAAPSGYKTIPTPFNAALGDHSASFGTNAHEWVLWTVDPGLR
jgi:hypothetical protein